MMQIAERWRFQALIVGGVMLSAILVARLFFLQFTSTQSGSEFLRKASEQRITSFQSIPAVRGEIVDRNGRLLAYSTPTISIGFRHGVVELDAARLALLGETLDLSVEHLSERLASHDTFVYLRRRMPPEQANAALQRLRDELDIEAKAFASAFEDHVEYKRFYPAGEVAAHVVGYTGISDQGQEGIELAYDASLAGIAGRREIIRNARRQIIGESRLVESSRPGSRIELTLDLQLQAIAYAELKTVVEQFSARSASLVVLDVSSGEILALVNQPSYNANDRATLLPERVRNRALLDVFEPGSTVKPFTFAAGLQEGIFDFATEVDTAPGRVVIDGQSIIDPANYGLLSAADALIKSSQVGTAKLAMQLSGDSLRDLFGEVGFGEYCATGFPGEQVGYLPSHRSWKGHQKAVFGYGYGMEVNALQLARAYAVLGDDGQQKPVVLVRSIGELDASEQQAARPLASTQAIAPEVARSVRDVLSDVVSKGTGKRAAIPGYRVAGKTGTVHQVARGEYLDDKYRATFAGMLPADKPRLVAVVTVDQPQGDRYYGGEVAAPVFARVMAEAARLLNIAPSELPMNLTAANPHGAVDAAAADEPVASEQVYRAQPAINLPVPFALHPHRGLNAAALEAGNG